MVVLSKIYGGTDLLSVISHSQCFEATQCHDMVGDATRRGFEALAGGFISFHAMPCLLRQMFLGIYLATFKGVHLIASDTTCQADKVGSTLISASAGSGLWREVTASTIQSGHQ